MNFARMIKRKAVKKEMKKKGIDHKLFRKYWRNIRIREVGPVPFLLEYNRTTKSNLSLKEIYNV